MAPAAVGTLVATALLVAVLALYLIMIATHLTKVSQALDVVLGAVTGIAGQTKPAPGVVDAIAQDVGAIQGALHGLIALATSGAPAAAPAAPAPAPAPAAAPSGGFRSAAARASGPSKPRVPASIHNRRR